MSNKALAGLRPALLLAAACLLFLPALTAARQGGTAHYLYDDNGRLKAVLLPSGEPSVYNYDAAGNLVSITKARPDVLSVLDFTPKAGNVGAPVTIYGT